ncbi:MAG: phenylacetate--CoA ligase [Planctomycetota bacterium]|jgi:phenylacetate-CoA ligase|nr:phenylacetate--CoA ligase [Planctomycetota bacterium]
MKKLGSLKESPFNPASAMDYLPEAELRRLQLGRLQESVRRAYHDQRCGQLKSRMDEIGMTPGDVKTLEDIRRLPFMTKTDLRDTYPYGLFALPDREVVRIHASSGTTGKPIVVGYSRNDLDVWTDAMRRGMIACGLSENDVIQVSYGYGLFTGGLGAHYGGEALGATVIPTSGGNTERQVMVIQDFGTTAICCTPSYFAHITEKAADYGVDLKKTRLRVGVFGAEPWSDAMRRHLEEISGIQAQDVYGLSEISGPGVALECLRQDGLHIFEDYFYPEIIDLETLEPVPDGVEGELVITTLCKEAMPMIRYRTRDITSLLPGRCGCGRTLRRINRIGRRSDDMMIIRGVNVFPSQIETALLRIKGLSLNYQIVLTREAGLDQMEVKVEMTPDLLGDRIMEIEEVQKAISHSILSITGIHAKVTIAEPKSLSRSEGKAKRVFDRRQL